LRGLYHSSRVQCENWKRADQLLDDAVIALTSPEGASEAGSWRCSASRIEEGSHPGLVNQAMS
jgi:hypothetical protein